MRYNATRSLIKILINLILTRNPHIQIEQKLTSGLLPVTTGLLVLLIEVVISPSITRRCNGLQIIIGIYWKVPVTGPYMRFLEIDLN